MAVRSDWHHAFRQWLTRPSPCGEWLYRGQAASNGTILPSLLRGTNYREYGSQLRELSYKAAAAILASSPVLSKQRIHPELIDAPLFLQMEQAFGKPVEAAGISLNELIRALAQHYGFPTRFVDLTRNPIVAAFFATYSFADGSYNPSTEPGVIYRWPVLRKSSIRLELPLDVEVAGCVSIGAIDLSGMHPLFRRPRNQAAVVAKPALDPAALVVPTFFQRAPEDLTTVDLSQLPSCDRFELPAGAGKELTECYHVDPAALFPDAIDLGYSYLSLMAFLSLAAPLPEDSYHERSHEPQVAASLKRWFEGGVRVVGIVGDRECLRLTPDCPFPERIAGHSLHDAEADLRRLASAARDGARQMTHQDVRQYATGAVTRATEAALETLRIRVKAWNQAVKQLGSEHAGLMMREDLQPGDVEFGASDWVVPEIDRRLNLVLQIVKNAEKVPAYAFADPVKHAGMLDALPSDADYERLVTRQLAAQETWLAALGSCPGFAGLEE